MNCMSCGCQVHTSKLPINVCDDCEVMVDEVQNQNLPETKEDISWSYYDCAKCGSKTGYLKGTEPACVKCSLANGKMKTIHEYEAETANDNKIYDSSDNTKESHCLQDILPSSDSESLEKIKDECASLGCNKCLADTSYDVIEWPKHYNQGKIQPIDVIEDWNLDFRLANTIKYIARAGKKDMSKTKQDLEKAIWYIQRYIDKEL